MNAREQSPQALLLRRGFADPAQAQQLLDEVAPQLTISDALVDACGEAADPDLALRGLLRWLRAHPEPTRALADLAADVTHGARLTAVMGVSDALTDHLVRHPEDYLLLAGERFDHTRPTADSMRTDLLNAVGADPLATVPTATGTELADAMRVAYRRQLLMVAARDLWGGFPVDDVAAELADLAAATLEAALAIARSELPAEHPQLRFAIIGMGKCGGRELNYVSDVDVVYVVEPAVDQDETEAIVVANRLAGAIARMCIEPTVEGSIWEVDAALRPEGKAGPLTRTLASHRAYYERWAKTWEFQALLKARPLAGDKELGNRYIESVSPMVWHAAAREGFVDDVQSMRRRVEEQIPAGEVDRQLKLGPGGLRDVEFSVQLLQLVHGRSDESLRSVNTLQALAALAQGGYVGRDDAAALDAAYRFLRTLEHRIQLHRLRRTHLMPTQEADLRRLGRSVGFRKDPVVELTAEWRRHAREVRRLHEKLFYRPLLHAVARLGDGEARLSPEAAKARIEALGYRDPAGALRHIEALTSGVSRRAAIQRTLLPVMLGWFADAPDPDGGLLAFRRVSEALGSTHWYLALLRDAGATAQRLAKLLASSRFATDLLLRAPEAVTMLADEDELLPRSRAELLHEMQTTTERSNDSEAAAAAIRAIRRRELFRISASCVLGLADESQVGDALTELAAAVVGAALSVARRAVLAAGMEPSTRFTVIGMGRFGGHELGLGSDLDVMFVHDPVTGSDEEASTSEALAIANELRRLLGMPGADPPVGIDADLRPEGRSGPLVRSLGSYREYYAKWSLVWESQALLRAEVVAGDGEVGQRFLEMIQSHRWPAEGLSEGEILEIRRLKARVESERLPRGVDPAQHTKLGRGGLSDIEWTVQLLQLRYAAVEPTLKTTKTLGALHAAQQAELINSDDAATLERAWLLATRVRNAIVLVRGRADDTLPKDRRELSGVAGLVGYPSHGSEEFIEDYRRATRRARAVVERVFYK